MASLIESRLLCGLFVLLASGCLLFALRTLGVGGVIGDAGSVAYHAVMFASGAICLWRAWHGRSERLPWALLGAAIVVWGLADTYNSLVLQKQEAPPFPSIADAGWLFF